MGRYATKRYVQNVVKKSEWSPVYRVSFDFDDAVLGAPGSIYNFDIQIRNQIDQLDLGATRIINGTDGYLQYEYDYKIEYIRVHLRVALGENETTSANSQTIRVLIYRYHDNLSDYNGTDVVASDVDAMPQYGQLFGEINGLWMDKSVYIRSLAADSDTTSAGQAFMKKVIRPKHSNTLTNQIIDDSDNWDTQKGLVLVQIVGDDPDGVNARAYGWIECGYRIKY